ncbi:MAG: hypothetical protein ACREOO_01055 [bacterium]
MAGRITRVECPAFFAAQIGFRRESILVLVNVQNVFLICKEVLSGIKKKLASLARGRYV